MLQAVRQLPVGLKVIDNSPALQDSLPEHAWKYETTSAQHRRLSSASHARRALHSGFVVVCQPFRAWYTRAQLAVSFSPQNRKQNAVLQAVQPARLAGVGAAPRITLKKYPQKYAVCRAFRHNKYRKQRRA